MYKVLTLKKIFTVSFVFLMFMACHELTLILCELFNLNKRSLVLL